MVEVLESLYVVLVMEVARVEVVPIPILLTLTILMVVVAGAILIVVEMLLLHPLVARLAAVVATMKPLIESIYTPLMHIAFQMQALVLLAVGLMLLVAGLREELL
tara:strand:+ start:385 stop:699 length:315 start_codon:yes stop_codon:yes gene_type:complete